MRHSRRLPTAWIFACFLLCPTSWVCAQGADDGRAARPEPGEGIRIRLGPGVGRNVLSAIPSYRNDKTWLLEITAVQEELKLEGDVLKKVKLAMKGHSTVRRQINVDTLRALKAATEGNGRQRKATKQNNSVTNKPTSSARRLLRSSQTFKTKPTRGSPRYSRRDNGNVSNNCSCSANWTTESTLS